ncbi:MAG: hypothetical protein IJT73_10750 [Selenomonadaceae bacterium]|nr:hypothetical protein [Selenomonadaceae bacterium]
MISTEDIFFALKDAVNRAAPNLFVTAEHLQTSKESYAWIQFRQLRIDEGFGMFRRNTRVNIQVVLSPDEFTEIYHSDLYAIADAFDEEFCGYVKVADRFITIYETNAHIFDNILHYEFILDFADYVDKFFKAETEDADFMEDLHIQKKD